MVDGPGGFLPEMPADIRGKGEHNIVPEIIGVNAEDGYIYLPFCKSLIYMIQLGINDR